MCNWRWIADSFAKGLKECYGEEYGKNFKEMIYRTPIGEINKDIKQFIFERFVEYICNIIRYRTENYDSNILDYVENTVNDFYRKIIVTNNDEIPLSYRKYIMIDFLKTDITTNEDLFYNLFKKSKRRKTEKIFVIHKDTEIPPYIYFWIFKTEIAVTMENIYIMSPRMKLRLWSKNSPVF